MKCIHCANIISSVTVYEETFTSYEFNETLGLFTQKEKNPSSDYKIYCNHCNKDVTEECIDLIMQSK